MPPMKEELIKELEKKNADLERFIYTVSHELRQPLITIKGFWVILRKMHRKVSNRCFTRISCR